MWVPGRIPTRVGILPGTHMVLWYPCLNVRINTHVFLDLQRPVPIGLLTALFGPAVGGSISTERFLAVAGVQSHREPS